MTVNPITNRPNPQAVRSFLLNWQKTLCASLESLQQSLFPDSPPSPFRFDHWQRDGQPDAGQAAAPQSDGGAAKGSASVQPALRGGGISAVTAGGPLWEKAGVNFSHVSGASLPPAASARHPHLAGRTFEAMGVSIVIHPLNPYVPTTHANIRFLTTASCADNSPEADAAKQPTATGRHNTFAASSATARTGTNEAEGAAAGSNPSDVWWFGGGFDLTPYYGFEQDAVDWHRAARAACQPFGAELYPKFKQWCDRYFYLPHRDEARGIGGLFFDDTTCDGNFDAAFGLSRSIAEALFAAYAPIVKRRAQTPHGERERAWQLYRRGRYVEFNLICDRGTHFGLQSRGRTESILMSLPPLVRWEYDYHPEAGSPEAALLEQFLPPRNWLPA